MSAPGDSAVLEAGWRNARGRAPGLVGLSGRIAFEIADEPAGVIVVEPNGSVSIADGDDSGAARVSVDSEDTLEALLKAEVSPMVAWLQGRLHVEGDLELAVRVLLGLEAGSPWAAQREG